MKRFCPPWLLVFLASFPDRKPLENCSRVTPAASQTGYCQPLQAGHGEPIRMATLCSMRAGQPMLHERTSTGIPCFWQAPSLSLTSWVWSDDQFAEWVSIAIQAISAALLCCFGAKLWGKKGEQWLPVCSGPRTRRPYG